MSAAIEEILPDVFQLLRQRAGMDPASFGIPGIAHALGKRIRASQAGSPRKYLHRLGRDAAEFQELLEELVVPETWFFREMQAFGRLAAYLDEWRSSHRGVVRLLSAACSTGEEVYSIAIVLAEAGLPPEEFCILGTDISQKSLAVARAATYPSRSFRDPDDAHRQRRERWCRPEGEAWQVCDELRRSLAFRSENLSQPEFLRAELPFHVVFCRNVLIYFHADARRTAVRHLHRLLRPDGLLFTAPAEARIFSDAGFPSLGSECPFAFRRPEIRAEDQLAEAVRTAIRPSSAPAVPARAPPRVKASPRRDTGVGRPPAAPITAREAESGAALLAKVRQAADNGQLEEASALCEQALAAYPTSAEAHYLRGLICQAQSSWSEAERCFEKSLYLQPKYYQALVHLMLLAEQRGDHQTAANYRRRAHQAAPGEAE